MRGEVIKFVSDCIAEHYLKLKKPMGRVLDVGSFDVNGSIKPCFELTGWKYTGFDVSEGPGVDVVGDAEKLSSYFPGERFDCVVSCETLEHVQNLVVVNEEMRHLVKPGGMYILTIAGNGFREHRHPIDCWRVLPDGMKWLLRDFEHVYITECDRETLMTGIMGVGWKPMS